MGGVFDDIKSGGGFKLKKVKTVVKNSAPAGRVL
jgi:hypothetical protein